jgi:hypothetical protein
MLHFIIRNTPVRLPHFIKRNVSVRLLNFIKSNVPMSSGNITNFDFTHNTSVKIDINEKGS